MSWMSWMLCDGFVYVAWHKAALCVCAVVCGVCDKVRGVEINEVIDVVFDVVFDRVLPNHSGHACDCSQCWLLNHTPKPHS